MLIDHPIVILLDPYQVQRDELLQILKKELVASCRITTVSNVKDCRKAIKKCKETTQFDEKGLSLIVMANITDDDCLKIKQTIVSDTVPTILVVDGKEAEEPHDGMADTVIGRKAVKRLSLKRLTNGTLNGLLK